MIFIKIFVQLTISKVKEMQHKWLVLAEPFTNYGHEQIWRL